MKRKFLLLFIAVSCILFGNIQPGMADEPNVLWNSTLSKESLILDVEQIGDITGDGKTEIVVGIYDFYSPNVYVLSGLDGSVVWQQSVGGQVSRISPHIDVDGDGVVDNTG